MLKLTTPKSILIGFFLIAVSIASIPYSNLIVPKAYADDDYYVVNEILNCIDEAEISLYGDMSGGVINLTSYGCRHYL